MGIAEQSIDVPPPKPPHADLDEVTSSLSWIEAHQVTDLRIDTLVLADSPRMHGEDEEHVRVLAELGDALPPIAVHRSTMRVIDGVHRVLAASLNGRSTVRARLLDCDEQAAFVLSVKANVTHGLPLSQTDRASAAVRIIAAHPQWSDRAVAAATALSGKTVARIRSRATESEPQSNSRVGCDGRLRPLDSSHRRRRAAAMIRDNPDIGLRAVARATDLSPATVRDVRQRIERGADPVPMRYRSAGRGEHTDSVPTDGSLSTTATSSPTMERACHSSDVDVRILLTQLGEDPSLRLNEAGRRTLHWLRRYTVDAEGLEQLGQGLPDHWAPTIADLARGCAESWEKLADQLRHRAD